MIGIALSVSFEWLLELLRDFDKEKRVLEDIERIRMSCSEGVENDSYV